MKSVSNVLVLWCTMFAFCTACFGQTQDTSLTTTLLDTARSHLKPAFGVFGFSGRDRYSPMNGLIFGYNWSEKSDFNGLAIGAANRVRYANGISLGLLTGAIKFNGLQVGLVGGSMKHRGINIAAIGVVDTIYGINVIGFNYNGKLARGISVGVLQGVQQVDGILAGMVNGALVNGIQLGFISGGEIRGIEVSAIAFHQTINGIGLNFVSTVNQNNGMVISLLNYAVDKNLITEQKETSDGNWGVEFGLLNLRDLNAGLQIGLINYAKRNSGVQIGVVNISNGSFFPVVKFW